MRIWNYLHLVGATVVKVTSAAPGCAWGIALVI